MLASETAAREAGQSALDTERAAAARLGEEAAQLRCQLENALGSQAALERQNEELGRALEALQVGFVFCSLSFSLSNLKGAGWGARAALEGQNEEPGRWLEVLQADFFVVLSPRCFTATGRGLL